MRTAFSWRLTDHYHQRHLIVFPISREGTTKVTMDMLFVGVVPAESVSVSLHLRNSSTFGSHKSVGDRPAASPNRLYVAVGIVKGRSIFRVCQCIHHPRARKTENKRRYPSLGTDFTRVPDRPKKSRVSIPSLPCPEGTDTAKGCLSASSRGTCSGRSSVGA
uniref:Uncharacterized protein n=1 Tax=Panagrellus redivivus TaxID=6233 RepID=A0A7E4VIH4_PANRE